MEASLVEAKAMHCRHGSHDKVYFLLAIQNTKGTFDLCAFWGRFDAIGSRSYGSLQSQVKARGVSESSVRETMNRYANDKLCRPAPYRDTEDPRFDFGLKHYFDDAIKALSASLLGKETRATVWPETGEFFAECLDNEGLEELDPNVVYMAWPVEGNPGGSSILVLDKTGTQRVVSKTHFRLVV